MSFATAEERNAYARDWYARNRERQLAYQRKWRAENKQRTRKYAMKCRKARPMWSELLTYAKDRAKKRGLPFELTKEWAELRWTGCCELTGLPFTSGIGKGRYSAFSPSIDKIEQSKGYTQDNCRFVLQAVNLFHGTWSDAEMLNIAYALAARHA